MQVHIDWLSFTGKRTPQEGDTISKAMDDAFTYLEEINPVILDVIATSGMWKWGGGRKPYSASYQRADFGISIYVHPRLPHFLIEMTGKGCASLSDHPSAQLFLESVTPLLTRLDLACDMTCDTDPLAFVSEREEGRFKAHSEFVSESGTTAYVGSRTSNRYARVYRYNPPHERSHLLRSEFVVKGEDAKRAATAILAHGHLAVAKTLGTQFGWQHASWFVESPTEAELRAYRPDRREGKTIYWLADTVAPLLVRLSREGTIDVQEWFATNVLRFLENDDTL